MKKFLLVTSLLALIFTVPFWINPSLDIAVSAHFYHPGSTGLDSSGDAWTDASNPIWMFFYKGAPIIAILTGIVGVTGVVIGSLKLAWRRYRMWGVAVLMTLALGPGLLVNVLGKDHAGRPRPRQIHELGGDMTYRPPLLFSLSDGKSFPCGHCSVGFALIIFALILKPRRPRAALAVLIFSLILGALMGAGRVAAGAHFFSDVLWSGLITGSTAWIVYHAILRIPEREADPEKFPPIPTNNPWILGSAIAASVVVLAGVCLLATPYEQSVSGSMPAPNATSVWIHAPAISITIVASDSAPSDPGLSWDGSLKGFGFPGRRIDVRPDKITSTTPLLDFHKHGVFTDLEGVLTLKVNASQIHTLKIKLPASATLSIHDHSHGPAKFNVEREVE